MLDFFAARVNQHRREGRHRSATRDLCPPNLLMGKDPSSENQTFTFQDTSALFVLKIDVLRQILPANIHSSRK